MTRPSKLRLVFKITTTMRGVRIYISACTNNTVYKNLRCSGGKFFCHWLIWHEKTELFLTRWMASLLIFHVDFRALLMALLVFADECGCVCVFRIVLWSSNHVFRAAEKNTNNTQSLGASFTTHGEESNKWVTGEYNISGAQGVFLSPLVVSTNNPGMHFKYLFGIIVWIKNIYIFKLNSSSSMYIIM